MPHLHLDCYRLNLYGNKNMVDVSIILVNYNTKELTKQCIDSLFEYTNGINFEIILVDNASSDGSIEYFSKDRRIKFIESGSNLGFGKANNLGVQNSVGDYVFFLNTDTVLKNNAIKIMYDWMVLYNHDLNVGALGCLLLGKDGVRTHSYSRFPNAWRLFREIWIDHLLKRFGHKTVMKLDHGVDESPEFFEVDYVTGADIFVKKEVLEQYGKFDPDFFMYYEESEMQYRWKKAGLHNFILKGPQIVHLEGGSATSVTFVKLMRNIRSSLIFYKKTMPVISYGLFRCFYPLCYLHLFFTKAITAQHKKELFKILCT